MKKTFNAIRSGGIELVRSILDSNPEEINAIAKQPPKKDDGQSLLQVALKTGNLEIAGLLLDYGANVNFMESAECCNSWRMPVLHDAIRCAVMNSRWNSRDYLSGNIEAHSDEEQADEAYRLLARILEMGAEITSVDSKDNTVLDRAVLDARQLLPKYNYSDGTLSEDRVVINELDQDLSRIFSLLYRYGANSNARVKGTQISIKDFYSREPVGEYIDLDAAS